ncbi:MAG TPA: YigZ family protein [Microlunatus sp.]
MASYETITGSVEAEYEDRRSRFICRLTPAADEETARAAISEVRTLRWDARHHCTAFVLGPDRATRRSSDDGEPSGTAGAPILQSLIGSGLTDLVAVVTRYFGGTLLGSGGLVRAYGTATRLALDAVVRRRFVQADLVRVVADHGDAPRLENELRELGVEVIKIDYAARVTLQLAVLDHQAARVAALVASITHGRSEVTVIGTSWRPAPLQSG